MKHYPAVSLIILMNVLAVTLFGQQSSMFTLHPFQTQTLNPALTGKEGSFMVKTGFRNQWSGLKGAPQTQILSISSPLPMIKSSIGILAENESLGARNQLNIQVQYAYQVRVSKSSYIGLGLGIGMHQMTLNGADLRTPEGNYEVSIEHNDPILSSVAQRGTGLAVNTGISYISQSISAGIGVRQIQPSSIQLGDIIQYKIQPEYNLWFGTWLDLMEDVSFHLSASALSDLTRHQINSSLIAMIVDKYYLGGAWRGYSSNTLESAGVIIGIKISSQISAMYGYDINLSGLNQLNVGSHELMITYDLGRALGNGVYPPIIYNPRYL